MNTNTFVSETGGVAVVEAVTPTPTYFDRRAPFFSENTSNSQIGEQVKVDEGEFLPQLSEDEEEEDEEGEGGGGSEGESSASSSTFTASEATSDCLSFFSSREIHSPGPSAPLAPTPDDYFFCDECGNWIEDGCLDHEPNFVEDDSTSSIGLPACVNWDGQSVVATESIALGSFLGPYQGTVVEDFVAKSLEELPYVWEVKKYNGKSGYFLRSPSGSEKHWMELIGVAESGAEQNLVAIQFKGDVYYKFVKSVLKGSPLLIGRGEGLPWTKGLDYETLFASGPYSCRICPARFTVKKKMERHLKSAGRHQPLDDILCRKCDFKASKRSELRQHLYNQHDMKPFACPVCDKRVASEKGLRSHFKRIHMKETGPKNACQICGKTFATKQHLNNHRSVHGEGVFECQICGQKLKSESSLKHHIEAVHSDGNRMYPCADCAASFTTLSYLKLHGKRIHQKADSEIKVAKTKSKPKDKQSYQCHFCPKVYSSPNARSRHEGKQHRAIKDAQLLQQRNAEAAQRVFRCTTCPAAFRTQTDLRYHEMRHTGNFPFNCQICSKGYPNNSELRKHNLRTHVMDQLGSELMTSGVVQ